MNKEQYTQFVKEYQTLADLVRARIWMVFDLFNKNRPFLRIINMDCIGEYFGDFCKSNFDDLAAQTAAQNISDRKRVGAWVTYLLEDEILAYTTNENKEISAFCLPPIFAYGTDEEFKAYLEDSRKYFKAVCYEVLD
ncbi:hypothetical protein ACPF04_05915 [Campylobacter sp. MOP51]|uniref:hypothetical protein n=1 Tax=Campylobacter canis TaxID=3378588 RepID=UPI003C395181